MRSTIQIQFKYSSAIKIIFIIAFIFCAFTFLTLGILLSGLKSSDWLTAYLTFYLGIATVILALTTAVVIIWQGQQLKKQLELQVITELYKEWNGEELFDARCNLCQILNSGGVITEFGGETLEKVENVLEFLERIASYYENEVLSRKLVWDTFGFYIMRYYFYTQNAIKEIHIKWSNDETLYRDLANLYKDLMDYECKERNKSRDELERTFINEINKFKKSECYEIHKTDN